MAKLKGPLFSVSAHGKLGRALSFSQRKGQALTKKYSYPHKAPTLSQLTQRTIIGLLNAQWAAMSAVDKLSWSNICASAGLRMSGYNYFIRTAQSNLPYYHGLVAYYPFNVKNGATAYDASGNGLDGTFYPTYPTNCPQRCSSINSKFGNAIIGDGIDDDIRVTHDAKLNFGTGQWTIETWAQVFAIGASEILISKQTALPEIQGFQFYINSSGYLKLGIGNGSSDTYIQAAQITAQKWYHLCMTREGTAVKQYINAELKGNHTITQFDTDTSTELRFLNKSGGGSAANAMIDDIRLYDRALSETELKKHYLINREIKRRQAQLV